MASLRTPLQGYEVIELLHSSSRTLVYRGLRLADHNTVIIKLLNCEYPTFSELVNFRNQYTIAKNLDLPGIVKPLALEHYGKGLALVMEDFGGIALSEYMAEHPLSLEEFFQVAIALCQILDGLYCHRVIHKDIKPSNILIHPHSKQIKLTDFSISSLLPRETQVLQNPNILEGTLAYISPEQTGRMNRGIDYRSDFYSLGVTFYELLTGQVPFLCDDPMELVHAHIAKAPPSLIIRSNGRMLCNPPCPISQIVMKLMAKNAENRYQSILGLKFDLEKCQNQWQQRGKIEPFELARTDRSDRFLIREKLYGRETNVQRLLEAFDRIAALGTTEMMLVAGFSGIGKTAVVNEVHKPIVKQRGYFIKGKFDQFNRNIPFSAFVIAFRDLMGQLLGESDADLARWKAKILEAVGKNGQVLIDVIPELEQLIGKQPPVPELSGNAGQNRFNLFLQKFIAVFAKSEHPLVMFLDDLQWADSASLNLLKVLMGDRDSGYLLLLGAYRDNEVFPAHPLMLSLTELKKERAVISSMTLKPLAVNHINQLVAETLSCGEQLAQPLTELVYQKTQGNPFFTTQFLKGLHEDRLIAFNRDSGYWQCDLVRVRDAALTDDVVEFMAGRLQKLPPATQKVLKLAACIGNQFDLETLATICEEQEEEVAANLWRALQEGLILPTNEAYKFFHGHGVDDQPKDVVSVGYRFLHDRVQQAAYSLIPEAQKQTTHYHIGQLLMQNLSSETKEKKIFAIVNQLNFGTLFIREWTEKEELARLNLSAGRKAKTSTAYAAAVKYFSVGRELLGAQRWNWAYELTLALYQESAEAAYLNADFEQMEQLSAEVLKKAKTLLDKIDVYITQIQSNIARVKLLEAIRISLMVLNLIDDRIQLPEQPDRDDFERALVETRSLIGDRSVADFLNLPEMEDPYQLAAIRILSSVAPPAYFAFPALFPLIVMKMVHLSIEFGNTSASGFGYTMYGFILCGVANDIELGCQFGELALGLIDKLNVKGTAARVLPLVGHLIKPWRESIDGNRYLLRKGYQVGLETGDLEFAGYSASFYCFDSIFVGQELESLEGEFFAYSEAITQLKQEHVLHQIHLSRQTILNLLGRADNPCALIGEAYNETEMVPLHEEANNRTTLAFMYVAKLSLCYLFQDYEQAVESAAGAEKYLDGVVAMLCTVLFYFYDALVKIILVTKTNSRSEQNHLLEQIESHQTKMKYWADNAPMNYLHKFYLVEAERNRILGQKAEAIENYDRAISGAKANGYIQEEALAKELAAKFYLDWGKEKLAADYMQDAYYCYSCWGAKAKVEDLERRYSALLKPILELPTPSLIPTTSLKTLTAGTISKTTTETSAFLDFATLMKACRTLSEDIDLESAIANLMQVVRENAGAETVALMIFQEGVLMLVARAVGEETIAIKPLPVEISNAVPLSIVNKVKRSQHPLLLENASQEVALARDTYIQHYQPQSILCLPLVVRAASLKENRAQLRGILYLENNHCAGAFTNDRMDILQLLCSQAAISLENARLYRRSQQIANNLQQVLTDLQQTQLQLVQNEKMATLGSLVAGIAHEINNPVSFIGGNISAAQEHLQDLLEILALYQDNASIPPSIAEAIEDLAPEFIAEDFPQLIASMQIGCDRIGNISTSLRTFSRKDTDTKTEFNLHDGIDSTLLILKYRLKANQKRPAMEIITNYGKIPQVKCYPGQINQVFMNLLANGIDALEECNQGKTFEQIEQDPNRITIETQLSADRQTVTIAIVDNGTGMPEEVKKRIFEQGFTTKAVGKGTGLGMAIAHQIVVEKHGGAISCRSELGQGTEFIISVPVN
ncbi:MAG: AAA family ATPase [Roseofilum sp. SID2]|uniref:trifunctional serine/threonine-protein kinase/ATP-binding protein/sensor histidine kinase n=1 Tax=Roseofilum sp. SID2 TaxID=2821498 RepID=UPI001B1E6234|nr:AAA family ATPase [Roseofilum sp. SID2]MBP0024228.1 AAA family ATPase [Roseofilum sp. SID2]